MKAAWLSFIFAVLARTHPNPGLSIPTRFGENTSQRAYLGFDRNEYPGDANLTALRRTLAFSGYWLHPPPGFLSTRNS